MSADAGLPDGIEVRFDHTDQVVLLDFNQGFTTLSMTPAEALDIAHALTQAVKKGAVSNMLGAPRV